MALKDAILETLSCMLSGNNDLRKVAEERQKALEVAEEYPLYLLEIILTADEAAEERQMACVLFSQFIKHHWIPVGHSSVSINESTRAKIKNILPMGLSDPLPKIRNATAHSMALLTYYEYPHNWLELLELISHRLKSGNYNEAMGVVMFLEECTRVLSVDVICLMAPALYSDLYNLCQNEMHAVQLRILVIQNVTKLILSELYNTPRNYENFGTTVSNFIMLFGSQLTNPYNSNNDFKLKSEIFKTFQELIITMDAIALQPIMSLLPTIFNLLQVCCEDYIKIIMNISIYQTDDDEEKNTLTSYDNLVDSIYSFISCIVEGDSPQCLYSVLPELVYSIILFMTITPEIEQIWREDEINMYTDDCEDTVLNNIRSVMTHLLQRISIRFDKGKLVAALNYAIEKHSNAANHLKAESEGYWWRIHECLMYAIGNIRQALTQPNMEFRDLSNYLVQWSDFMNVCNVDLVLGRIIWVGGKYSNLLDRQYTEKHIQAILDHLKSNHHVSRVLALRALYFHCEAFQLSNNTGVFKDNLNELLRCLVNMGNQSQGVTVLILDSMRNMVNLDKSLTAQHSSKIVPYMMETFLKNTSNDVIMHKLERLVSTLSQNLSMILPMQHEFLPLIVNVMQQPGPHTYDSIDIRTVTMDILTCFVKFAQTPLNNTLIEQGFMTVVRNMHMFNDIALLQSTARCLRAFLLQAPEEICHYTENDRRRGIELIMNIVSFFLNPSRKGCACNSVGKLIIACIKALGPFIETHIKTILKDVLTKMHNAFIKVYDDNIIIAFAFAFYQHYDSTVMLLSVIPGPDGGSALEFVFTRWIKTYQGFTDTYERNLNAMAFTQVLERAVMAEDQRVMKIMVTSNDIPEYNFHQPNNPQPEKIPVLVKIFKIIINTLCEELQPNRNQSEEFCQEVFDQNLSYETLEYMKMEKGLIDPLDARDPIYFMKLVDYLYDFLRKLAHHSYYCTIVAHLSPLERAEMGNLGLLLQPPAS